MRHMGLVKGSMKMLMILKEGWVRKRLRLKKEKIGKWLRRLKKLPKSLLLRKSSDILFVVGNNYLRKLHYACLRKVFFL